jgi:hypothetical protein
MFPARKGLRKFTGIFLLYGIRNVRKEIIDTGEANGLQHLLPVFFSDGYEGHVLFLENLFPSLDGRGKGRVNVIDYFTHS